MGMDYNQFMKYFRLYVWVIMLLLSCVKSLMADSVLSGHAMTMFDNEIPKYTATFPYSDYVNPTAPKGGTLRLAVDGTFDSFNSFIPKGNAASTGSVETLLVNSADEPFTAYGLVAETMEWPADRSWVCLLYTSPSPRDKRQSRMPSSA